MADHPSRSPIERLDRRFNQCFTLCKCKIKVEFACELPRVLSHKPVPNKLDRSLAKSYGFSPCLFAIEAHNTVAALVRPELLCAHYTHYAPQAAFLLSGSE